MKDESVIQKKSFAFALKVVKLSKYLISKRDYVLADQLLRCGTSIGANVEEGLGGHTLKEFSVRYSTAYKEARETKYWLRILQKADLGYKIEIEPLLADCEELLRLLGTAQRTLRAKIKSQS